LSIYLIAYYSILTPAFFKASNSSLDRGYFDFPFLIGLLYTLVPCLANKLEIINPLSSESNKAIAKL